MGQKEKSSASFDHLVGESLILSRRSAGVACKAAICSRARVNCATASTKAERSSDLWPALPHKLEAFSISAASVQWRANNSGRLSAISANWLSMISAMRA